MNDMTRKNVSDIRDSPNNASTVTNIADQNDASLIDGFTQIKDNSMLLALPNEILQNIMHELSLGGRGDVSEISLGLTCMRMHNIFKLQWGNIPIPNCLGNPYYNSMTGIWWDKELCSHISEFLGPKYRFRVNVPGANCYQNLRIPFLNRLIYGDSLQIAEHEYNSRWHDYGLLKNFYEFDPPTPFALGNDWYEIAFPRIHEKITQYEAEHKRKWDEWVERLVADWRLPMEQQMSRQERKMMTPIMGTHTKYVYHCYGKYVEWLDRRDQFGRSFGSGVSWLAFRQVRSRIDLSVGRLMR